MVYEKSFESVGELLSFLETSKSLKPNQAGDVRLKDSSSFNAYTSFRGAMELAEKGWQEGTEQIEKYSSQFINLIGSQLRIDEYFYDVTGQDFDLDRVLVGEPEAWLNSEQVEVKAPALETLRLVVNIGASSAVEAKTIERKGAAIVALIRLLELTRRRVEVVAITRDCYSRGESERGFNFNLIVKEAGQDLDLAKMAFVFCHAAMLRRLQFGVMDAVWVGQPSGRGHSSDTRLPASDIYVGCSHISNKAFLDDASTIEWLLDELRKQGVELKEEGV